MIRDFLDSWPLFATTWIVGWLAAALLSLLGVIVVVRDQVFLGAAISQVSTLGVALAMWLGAAIGESAPAWMHSSGFLTGTAIAASIAAATVSMRAGRARAGGRSGGVGGGGRGGGRGGESREAITGWLFLLGAAGSVVVVSHSPHGLEEVQRLLASSLLGATRADAWAFAGLIAVAAAALAVLWRPTVLWLMDPPMAAAAGVRTGALELALALTLGLTIGLSIRATGLLFTFGCLVLPAVIARRLVREVRSMFFLAPAVGLVAAFAGFILANHYDTPPGQMTAALLALAVPVAWVLGPRRGH
jgi:ABC-type Mn2+/Zn2+ transport system permease subunit